MKNKRLTIFLSILVFLVLVIVLSSAVFALKNVEVRFVTTVNVLQGKEKEIIDSGNFRYGENVFFTNKKEYTKTLEKANPYLKITNLQLVFPNKLLIDCAERNECYVIKLENNKYIKLDEDLKVLSTSDVYYNNASNGIFIYESNLENQNVTSGDFLLTETTFLTSLFNCFREWDLSYVNLKSKIESITLNFETKDNLLVKMRSGVNIVISKSSINLSDKLNLAFSFYDNPSNDYTKEGIIEIRQNSNNQIVGYYYK